MSRAEAIDFAKQVLAENGDSKRCTSARIALWAYSFAPNGEPDPVMRGLLRRLAEQRQRMDSAAIRNPVAECARPDNEPPRAA